MASKKNTKKEETAAPEFEFPKGVDRDCLIALGDAINNIIFAGEEPILYGDMEDEELMDQIMADAKQIDPKDAFADEQKNTLADLGIEIAWADEAPAEKKGGKGKSAAAGKVKGEKPAAKPKKEKTTTVSRAACVGLALKKAKSPVATDDLVKSANALYVENGGKDNLKESKWAWGVISQALVAAGLIEIKDNAVSFDF